jgi:hypothetical protein
LHEQTTIRHKHYFGDIFFVDDFTKYEELLDRFEAELEAVIK